MVAYTENEYIDEKHYLVREITRWNNRKIEETLGERLSSLPGGLRLNTAERQVKSGHGHIWWGYCVDIPIKTCANL